MSMPLCVQLDLVTMGVLHALRQAARYLIARRCLGGDPWYSAQRWALNWLVLMAVQCGYELRMRSLYRKTLRSAVHVSDVSAQASTAALARSSAKAASADTSAAAGSSSLCSKATTPQLATQPRSATDSKIPPPQPTTQLGSSRNTYNIDSSVVAAARCVADHISAMAEGRNSDDDASVQGGSCNVQASRGDDKNAHGTGLMPVADTARNSMVPTTHATPVPSVAQEMTHVRSVQPGLAIRVPYQRATRYSVTPVSARTPLLVFSTTLLSMQAVCAGMLVPGVYLLSTDHTDSRLYHGRIES